MLKFNITKATGTNDKKKSLISYFLIRIGSIGVLREPSFQYAFFLLKNFFDSPEGRKSKNATNGRYKNAFYKQRSYCSGYT